MPPTISKLALFDPVPVDTSSSVETSLGTAAHAKPIQLVSFVIIVFETPIMRVMRFIFIELLLGDAVIAEMQKHGGWKDAVIRTDHVLVRPLKHLQMTQKRR